MSRARLAALLALLVLPAAARAHGVAQEIERRGGGYAVRLHYHHGHALAGAVYEVFSPAAPDRPWREGRTGADGWVEFRPDAPGTWRVRIADATGHGGVVRVDVPAPTPTSTATPTPTPTATPTPAPTPAPTPTPTSTPTPTPTPTATATAADREGAASGPGPLRIAAGALVIVGVFAAIRALRRRRGGA